jgi:hypothetical protein
MDRQWYCVRKPIRSHATFKIVRYQVRHCFLHPDELARVESGKGMAFRGNSSTGELFQN